MSSTQSGLTLSVCARLLAVLLACLGSATAQCYNYQELELLQRYYIHSPHYPQNYARDAYCLWRAVTLPGAQIRLQCHDFNMPLSRGCHSDHVAISRSGELNAGDTSLFCGSSPVDIESRGNKMSLKLVTRGSKIRGYFSCFMIAFESQGRDPPIWTIPPPRPDISCDCGVQQYTKRIVGGTETRVNEFPMMAALIDAQLRVLYCGATLISPEFVMTAAHCLFQKTPDMVAILVGDHDITTDSDTDTSELIQVVEFIPHPYYDRGTQAHDIALVRLAEPATYSDDIASACLPFALYDKSFDAHKVIALGWGTTESTWPMSATLKKTNLNIISARECREAYPYDGLTELQLCTFSNHADACQFDEGGPLLYEDPDSGSLFVIGVISYGTGCLTETPNINTRVDAYLDWIEYVTKGLAALCLKDGNRGTWLEFTDRATRRDTHNFHPRGTIAARNRTQLLH